MPGKSGQFDVLLDGTLIAKRGGGFLTRLLGGGWPDEAEVVAKIQSSQGGTGSGLVS